MSSCVVESGRLLSTRGCFDCFEALGKTKGPQRKKGRRLVRVFRLEKNKDLQVSSKHCLFCSKFFCSCKR